MKCMIEIDMDNSAFDCDPSAELASILADFSRKLQVAEWHELRAVATNGNLVGHLSIHGWLRETLG
jgi:hypothetical protein